MFPSSGYFKGINCPFFNSGLCERPYCHFRHVKITDGSSSSLSATGQFTYSKDEKKVHIEKQSVIEYRPTPIHLLKSITPSSESEYDPVKNYSSSDRCNASVKRHNDSYVDSTSAKKVKLQTYDSVIGDSISDAEHLTSVGDNKSKVASAVNYPATCVGSTVGGVGVMECEQVGSTDVEDISVPRYTAKNQQQSVENKSSVVTHNGSEIKKTVSHKHLPAKKESENTKTTGLSKHLPLKEESVKLKSGDSGKYVPPKEEGTKLKSSVSSKHLPAKEEVAKFKSTNSGKHLPDQDVGAKVKLINSSKHSPDKEAGAKSTPTVLSKYLPVKNEKEKLKTTSVHKKTDNKSTDVHEHKNVDKELKTTKLSKDSSKDLSLHRSDRHRDGSSRTHSKQSDSSREQLPDNKKHSSNYHKSSGSTGISQKNSADCKTKRLSGVRDVESTKQNQSATTSAKSVARPISTIELFGEDSDTENINSECAILHQGLLSPPHQRHIPVVSSPPVRHADGSASRQGHLSNASSPAGRQPHIGSVSSPPQHHMNVTSTSADECDDVNLLSMDGSSESGDSAVDIFEQCQQIYSDFARQQSKSNHPSKQTTSAASVPNKTTISENLNINNKKRLAHVSSTGSIPPKRHDPPSKRNHITPAQQMLSRIEAIRKSREAQQNLPVLHGNVKHDNVVTTNNAKSVSHKDTAASSTVASASHVKRVAHVPAKIDLKRPTLAPDSGSKIPINLRQNYLNRFFDDCVKIYENGKDATDRAFSEEKSIFDRSSMKSVYVNLAIHTIRRLRDEVPGGSQLATSPNKNPHSTSHEAVLGGPKATSTSYSVKRSGRLPSVPDKLSDSDLYQRLKKYLLTDAQLVENGYPRSDDSCPGLVTIKVSSLDKNHVPLSLVKSDEKICSRCGKRFLILPDGSIPVPEQCVYHWGKAFKKRIAGSMDNSYTCCQGDLNTKGCSISACHVHERNKYSSLSGYMKTLPASSSSRSDSYGVFALDCEMIYTTEGSELARVTVVNSNLDIVYEAMVRPEHQILDYNTRFSGITKESLESVKTGLRDVQAVLLSIFNEKSILIGHSLESDFIALKLIHSCVIDTSVVFPHRLGLPYKRALRNLAGEILQRIIQNDVGGHDSAEDARTCMELMTWKLKEDIRRESRR